MINSIAKTSRARVIAAKQRADRRPHRPDGLLCKCEGRPAESGLFNIGKGHEGDITGEPPPAQERR